LLGVIEAWDADPGDARPNGHYREENQAVSERFDR